MSFTDEQRSQVAKALRETNPDNRPDGSEEQFKAWSRVARACADAFELEGSERQWFLYSCARRFGPLA